MRHKIWLFKEWPKEGNKNSNPSIYCLDSEWNDKQAEAFLRENAKNGPRGLIQVYGYDSPKECIVEEGLNELYEKGPKPKLEEIVTSLSYEGKVYYFPKEGLVRNPFDNTYSFLFKQ